MQYEVYEEEEAEYDQEQEKIPPVEEQASIHKIINNLENLKRERANSGERRTTSELKKLTDELIQDQMLQIT